MGWRDSKRLREGEGERERSKCKQIIVDAVTTGLQTTHNFFFYLADVLTEGWVGDHLTKKVQVGRHQCHDATADDHGHVLLISQGHILQPMKSFRNMLHKGLFCNR